MEKTRYVIDTNGIIAFFTSVFENVITVDESQKLSRQVRSTIREAIYSKESSVLLSVPSIIFIEIYKKWLHSDEFKKKFFCEVFIPLKESPNVEIRAIDQEVLENLIDVDGILSRHDMNDKIVVASAMTLECALITVDRKIIRFVGKGKGKIPKVLK